MEMKVKDIVRAQQMAEQALKKMKALEEYLETYIGDPAALQVFPRVSVATNNIFLIQDALGGEIKYVNWWGDKFCDGILTINDVEYMQFGLTPERIEGRKGALDL